MAGAGNDGRCFSKARRQIAGNTQSHSAIDLNARPAVHRVTSRARVHHCAYRLTWWADASIAQSAASALDDAPSHRLDYGGRLRGGMDRLGVPDPVGQGRPTCGPFRGIRRVKICRPLGRFLRRRMVRAGPKSDRSAYDFQCVVHRRADMRLRIVAGFGETDAHSARLGRRHGGQ